MGSPRGLHDRGPIHLLARVVSSHERNLQKLWRKRLDGLGLAVAANVNMVWPVEPQAPERRKDERVWKRFRTNKKGAEATTEQVAGMTLMAEVLT